ncbi:MAG TPA: wax ester/triacylglycerol synthase domain-containing protein [Terriglobales bacterium]|nr:wax ester/triacylglycerol synthase domain-containing protein [Terriglobales bacterium]
MTLAISDRECLSFGDALFLYLERDGMPLHVASLCIFDGNLTLNALRRQIKGRLSEVPRFQHKVVPPAWIFGVPTWERDADFRIENHIREVRLRRGDQPELQKRAQEILSTRLERHRPLWDMTLFTHLQENKSAVLLRVHHSVADGISGVELMKVIMDRSPDPRSSGSRKKEAGAAPFTHAGSRVLESMASSVFYNIDRILNAESELLTFAQQVVANGTHETDKDHDNDKVHGPLLDELRNMAPESLSATEPLPFNVVCRGPQKFVWAEIPFNEIRAVKRHFGTTVNDVVLALVASIVGGYLRAHHVASDKRLLRVVIPVSSRSRAQNGDLGNRISFVPVSVPLGKTSVPKLLDDVHERTQLLKNTKLAELIAFCGTMMGVIPTPLQAFLGPLVSQLPLNLCNLICTNVPGPPEPLYIAGHRLVACYPYVPIGGTMGMNCAVLTYNGKAFFGFTGDVNGIPDLELLPTLLASSFAKLYKCVPVTRTTSKKKAPTRIVETATRRPPRATTAEPVRAMAMTAAG